MRQKFSYILCAIFMLFGTNQIIQGASILAGASEELEAAAGKAGSEIEEGFLRGGIDEAGQLAAKSVANDLKAAALKAGQDILAAKGSQETAIAAVNASLKAQVEQVLAIASKTPATLHPGALPSEVISAGSKAAKIVADEEIAARGAQAVGTTVDTGAAARVVGAKPVAPKPASGVADKLIAAGKDFAQGAVDRVVPKSVQDGLASVGVFLKEGSDTVAHGATQLSGAIEKGVQSEIEAATSSKVGKVLLGMSKREPDTFVPVKRGTSNVERTADELHVPKDTVGSDGSQLFEDTLYDAKTGKPIKNPEPRPEGLSEYARASDPAYPRKTDGSFKSETKNGAFVFEEAPKTKIPGKPIMGPDGKPAIWKLSDIVGDRPILKRVVSNFDWIIGKGAGLVEMIVVQALVMGVAMSLPNQLMSSFMQERQQQAALATVAAPVQFGGVVMQIPDGFINETMPTSSLKMYVGIPSFSASSQTQWGGGSQPSAGNPVVGPDLGNPISQAIARLATDQVRAFFTTMMSATNNMESAGSSGSIPRYSFYSGDNINPSWYDNPQAHIFCSYSPQSWNSWGSSAITDPGFSGLMIDLNTGYIFAADGTTEGTIPAPLLGNIPNGAVSVETFLSNYSGTLLAGGKTFDFAQYLSVGQPDVDTHPDGSLVRQFSSACLPTDTQSKVLSGFADPCLVGSFRNSLLATSLVRLAAGACIGADGTEIKLMQQTLPTASSSSSSSSSTQSDASLIQSTLDSAGDLAAWNDWVAQGFVYSLKNPENPIPGAKYVSSIALGAISSYSAGVKALAAGKDSSTAIKQKAIKNVAKNSSNNGLVKTQALALPDGVRQTASTNSSSSTSASSKNPTAQQIADFYKNNPFETVNLAMQNTYRVEQAQYIMDFYDTFTLDQQNSFAQILVSSAQQDYLKSLLNDLYKMLNSSALAAFAKQVPNFKDTGDELAYLFAQVLAARAQSPFMKSVFSSLDIEDQSYLMQLYGSADKIKRFITYVGCANAKKPLDATTEQDQQSFINGLYAILSASEVFKTQLAGLKTNEDIIAYFFPFVASARIQGFLEDAIFDTMAPSKKLLMMQQYTNAQALESFVDIIWNMVPQSDKDAYAQNCLILAARAQASQAPQRSLTNATNTSGSAGGGLTASAVLEQAVSLGALGGVVPIYGFGNTFQDYINTNFSENLAHQQSVAGGVQTILLANQSAASQIKNIGAGVIQTSGVSVNSDGTKTDKSSIASLQGAPNLNYPAFGVYIYECINTPFAKELARLTNAQALDYIVFFDDNLNLVPLQVVAPNPRNYSFPDFILNPAIAYWASLICYIGNGSGPLDEFMGRYQDTSGTVQTFFPLYTLSGQLVYVDGAESAMDTVISSINKVQQGALIDPVSLYNQILNIAQLEVATYQNGPFYAPYNLHQADKTMWMTQPSSNASAASATSNIVPYVGMPPYPMPLNLGSTAGATDYLIPFVEEGGKSVSVQLPNPYVKMFVSLVTDIIFVVDVDEITGQATFRPFSFEYSQYNPTTGYNPNAVIAGSKTGGVWLNNLHQAGATIPGALKDDIALQRKAWITYISEDLTDATYKSQLSIPFGLKYTLSIATPDDYKHGNYMYRCFPSPSGLKLANDVFVMSANPTLPNATVGLMANAQQIQPYIVSMATGYMYDSNGAVVKDKSGKTVSMDFASLLHLATTNQRGHGGKGLPDATSAYLNQLHQIGQQLGLVKQGPYEFGSLLLYLYKIDVDNNNYVYFSLDASGTPKDYYVVVKSVTQPFVFGGPINSSTEHMVSLITGQLYTRTGVAGVWPDITTLLKAVKSTMSISSLDMEQINKLNALFIATAKNEAVEKSKAAAEYAAANALVAEDLSNTAINIVSNAVYLPSPYDSLVQDPATKKYYRVTPDANGKPFLIFDFNATSKSQDLGLGAMFGIDGKLVTTMKGIHLVMMRQQFGVEVDSKTGVQTLTIPHIAGNMNLSGKDLNLNPGDNGIALLNSQDAGFPTPGIPLKISSGTQTYYLYYHIFLASYFVYVVDSASGEKYYISMDDGTAYNLDGSARIVHYQVARDSKGNPMVVAQDSSGYLMAMLADPNAKSTTAGKYINFVNFDQAVTPEEYSYNGKNGMYGASALYSDTGKLNGNMTAVLVYQSFPAQPGSMIFNPAAQSYLVFEASGSEKTVHSFTVDAQSQVQIMTYVPLDASGKLITTAVSDILKSASFIVSADPVKPVIQEVIFNGMYYKATSQGALTFKSASGDTISVQTVLATSTCAAYAVITEGSKKYMYSYPYQTLSAADFTQFKQTKLGLNSAMSSTNTAVLCQNMHQMALKAVKVTDVKNVPASRSLALPGAIAGMQYDSISGKYFAPINAADYTYFGQKGFVDIENGTFYDSTGISYGYSLVLPDYIALLNKLTVMVVYNINEKPKKYDLVYRTAQAISQQSASQPAASGK